MDLSLHNVRSRPIAYTANTMTPRIQRCPLVIEKETVKQFEHV